MKTEFRPTNDIKPYDKNPRQNDKAVDAVAESITRFGFRQPIVLDGDGVIVVGHTRWKAAQKLGMEKVPVHVAKELTAEEARAYRLADNKSNELAQWDEELLAGELGELADFDIDWTKLGFKDNELAALLDPELKQGMSDANEIPDLPTEAVSKRGDLWLLGDHRLMCGDSTNATDVQYLMNGERASLFATDPPYLVDYDGKNHPHKWGEKDKKQRLVGHLCRHVG